MKKLQNIGRISRFFASGETLLGSDALAGLGRLSFNRAAVVVSQSVWSRHQKYINKCLSKLSIEVIQASKGEPKLKNAIRLAGKFKLFSPDVVIAIGGGSVIDISKLAWVLYEKPEMHLEYESLILPVSNLLLLRVRFSFRICNFRPNCLPNMIPLKTARCICS